MTVLTVAALLVATVPLVPFAPRPWLVLALTAPVLLWGAWPAHRAAWACIRRGRPGLDVLLAVALVVALGRSVALLLAGGGADGPEPLSLTTASPATTLAVAGVVATVAVAAGPARGRAARAGAVHAAVVLAVAVAGFGFWTGAAGPTAGLAVAVSVLLVGVPCALALCRDPEPVGSPVPTWAVDTVHAAGDQAVEPVLRLGGSVAARLDDPLAAALARAGAERTGALPDVAEFDERPGGGIGIVAELRDDRVVAHAVVVGPTAVLDGFGIALPPALTTLRAQPAIAVAWDGVARAVVTFVPVRAGRSASRAAVAGALAGHVVAVPAALAGMIGPVAALVAIALGALCVMATHPGRAQKPPVRATHG